MCSQEHTIHKSREVEPTQPSILWIDKTDKMWSIHKVGGHSAMKRNEGLTHAPTREP